jgi:Na+/H+ antiporter NhaC
MTFKEFMAWYFFLGLTTMLIGVYRNLKNKQSSEPDELAVLTWFLLWWIWLPLLIFRVVYLIVKNKNV